LRADTMTLLRQEVALAKIELGQKTSRVARDAAQIAIGGLIAYAGLIVLLFGLGSLLTVGLTRAGLSVATSAWLAPALIGLTVIVVGWIMFAKAKRALSSHDLVPEETLQSLRENKQWAETKLKHSHEPEPAL
jgi:xanthosine utilization system XapX-like protein